MDNISIAVQIQMKREKAVDEKELYLYSILEENRAFFDGMGNGRRLQTEDETETY